MVDSLVVAGNFPLQRVGRECGRDRHAIVDPRLNLRPFFVVIPGDQLHGLQLIGRVECAVDFRKGLEPGLAALLSHETVQPPGSQLVVKSLVSGAPGLFARQSHAGSIEFRQIIHSVICGSAVPGISSVAHFMAETAAVLKKK
jgi:hypothetical protein